MHFLRPMIFKDWVAFYNIKSRLKTFQPLEIFFLPQIEVDIIRKGIPVKKIEQRKIR